MKIKTKTKINYNVSHVDSINDVVNCKILNINTNLKIFTILGELFSEKAGVVTTLGTISTSIDKQTYKSYLNKFTSDKADKFDAQEQVFHYVLLEEVAKFLKITTADLEIV